MSNVALFSGGNVPAFARTAELSDTAKALAGNVGNTKRISIKGGVFRLVAGGKEVASIDERHLDVVIVKAAPKVSRVFYAASYDADKITAPDCWSNDGETPDASIKAPQHSACHNCPQNIAGSGTGNSRACRFQQRLAVVLENDMSGDVLQLTLPATSIFGKEEGDKRPLQAFARFLAVQSPPVSPEHIVTRMKFDTKAESPKLFFSPVRWLTDDEFGTIQNQGESDDAKRAVTLTVAQVDGLKSTPANIAGSAPKAVKAAQAKPAPAEVEDDEPAPAPTPKAKKVAAEPVEDTGEPEVRKTAAKADAAPAKKSKLADIVSDWDDE